MSGEKQRPLPQRKDALKIDVPFEDALRAAVETPPEDDATRKPSRKKKRPER